MLFKDYSVKYRKSFLWSLGAFLFDNLGSLFRKYKLENNNKPKKILVIRKDEIGDLILSIPMYEAIKKAYPKSHLSVLVGKPAAPLLEGNPFINKIISIETIRGNKKAFVMQYFNLIKQLKKEKFDLAIDPKGSTLNILLMYLIKAKNRLSYWNVSGGKPLLTCPVKYTHEMHDTDASLNLLREYGAKVKKVIPKLYFSASDKKNAVPFTQMLPQSYCCAYLTPTSPYKAWSVDNWRSLFNHFPEMPFFIVARESQRAELEKSMQGVSNVKLLCVNNLKPLAQVFSKAKAIVAVDGGMMHLAWISNPKTISLFGQVDLKLLLPPRGTPICHCPESEQGFFRQPIESQKPNKYMAMITVEEVAKALEQYIK